MVVIADDNREKEKQRKRGFVLRHLCARNRAIVCWECNTMRPPQDKENDVRVELMYAYFP